MLILGLMGLMYLVSTHAVVTRQKMQHIIKMGSNWNNNIAALLYNGSLLSAVWHDLILAGLRIEIVEYINRFRRLHGAGPLILSTRISVAAQNWAQTLVARGTTSIDPNTSYGMNVFTRVGTQTGLAQTVVITWYTSVKYYDWTRRKPKVLALPFIHMIWLSSNFVGVGLARSPSSKFYVVVYFDPIPGNKDPLLKDNVLPYTGIMLLSKVRNLQLQNYILYKSHTSFHGSSTYLGRNLCL